MSGKHNPAGVNRRSVLKSTSTAVLGGGALIAAVSGGAFGDDSQSVESVTLEDAAVSHDDDCRVVDGDCIEDDQCPYKLAVYYVCCGNDPCEWRTYGNCCQEN